MASRLTALAKQQRRDAAQVSRKRRKVSSPEPDAQSATSLDAIARPVTPPPQTTAAARAGAAGYAARLLGRLEDAVGYARAKRDGLVQSGSRNAMLTHELALKDVDLARYTQELSAAERDLHEARAALSASEDLRSQLQLQNQALGADAKDLRTEVR